MTRKQQRIYAIILVLAGVALAALLTLTALRDNITFFYSPSDITGPQAKTIQPGQNFRLGGMVVDGSTEKDGTITRFTVTDYAQDVTVSYDGILPALFREGQGVVAIGSLNSGGVFIAGQLLAKHDENYMPPEVAESLKNRHSGESRNPSGQQQEDSGLRRNDE